MKAARFAVEPVSPERIRDVITVLEDLPDMLAGERFRRGISQTEAGQELDLCLSAIALIESKKRHPSHESYLRILAWLIDEHGPKDGRPK